VKRDGEKMKEITPRTFLSLAHPVLLAVSHEPCHILPRDSAQTDRDTFTVIDSKIS